MAILEDNDATVNSPEIVSLDQLNLTYAAGTAHVAALEDINLKIHEGEFVCLLGPSGCGKSTLLKILAGFIPPSSGSATIDGTAIQGPDWHRGVVFQHPPLYPWLTVRDNIGFGLKMRGVDKKVSSELIDIYLEKVRLTRFAKLKPYELSGGMKQRVAIARVLVNNPRMLLMDEPFGALDALTREEMQNLVRSIWWETKKTVLFITHDVDEALSLGTRVLVMSRGPGKIILNCRTHFSEFITADNSNVTRASREFQQLRTTLLDLISNQPDISYAI
ncbi:MAG: ABC transporter ATP-binding protein [Desulfuromonadaceae bacterium]